MLVGKGVVLLKREEVVDAAVERAFHPSDITTKALQER